jgi:hypothetical protein
MLLMGKIIIHVELFIFEQELRTQKNSQIFHETSALQASLHLHHLNVPEADVGGTEL